jgi:mono/diheme cytochrome c family protein
MKHNFSWCALIFFVLISWWSCNKSAPAVPFTNPTMKAFFDTKCASCHASGKANAGAWLYDASDYQGSIVSHHSHLKEEVYDKKTMPPSGATAAELDAFKAWYDAGYPAN